MAIVLAILVYKHEEQGQFETEIKQPRELQSRYENYSREDMMQKRLDRKYIYITNYIVLFFFYMIYESLSQFFFFIVVIVYI